MYEVRDKSSGAILFKKSSTDKKIDQLEEEVKELKRLLLEQSLQGNLPQNQAQN